MYFYFIFMLLVLWFKGQRFDVDLENQSVTFCNFFILCIF